MPQKSNVFKSVLSIGSLSILFATAILSGCDMLQDDESDQQPKLEFVSDLLIITPAGSGIINLRSLIQSSGNYSFEISQGPSLGSLRSLGGDVLQYVAKDGIREGRDGFIVSVFSTGNDFLGQDSVDIVITQDSTNMPCAIYAINDYASYSDSTVVDGHLDIVVLANDVLCGVDLSQIELSIPDDLMEGGNPIPQSYYGTVSVLSDKKIRYTPNENFNGTDSIIYKLVKPVDVPNAGDPELTAFGYIFISSPPTELSCKDKFQLNDDFYVIDLAAQDTIPGDSADVRKIYLSLFNNDALCPGYSFEFSNPVNNGTLTEWNNDGELYYEAPPTATAGFEDSFTYEICIEGDCKEATVTITCE